MRILRPVVRPAAGLRPSAGANFPESGAVGPKPIRHDYLRLTMLAHCVPEEFQRSLLIARPGDEAFKHLAFVVHRASKVMHLTVDLNEHLVEMPPPAARAHALDAALSDLDRKNRPKSMPPEPDSLVAYVDSALVQQVFDISQRQGEPNVQHHGQADDLGARLEIANGVRFARLGKLRRPADRLKPLCFDSSMRDVHGLTA